MSGMLETAGVGLHGVRNSLSVPYVVAAALLSGLGLLALQFWIITFQWVYFLGVVPVTLGALMFLSPRAGSNSAE